MSTNRNKAVAPSVIPSYTTVESLTDSTKTLTIADSGKLFLLNRAAGITITLPSAIVGLTYTFFIQTAVTSNDYGIDTDGTDNYEGAVINVDKDQAYDSVTALQKICIAAGTETSLNQNGGTTGGLAGSWINLTAITTDRWLATGVVVGDGNLATVFA